MKTFSKHGVSPCEDITKILATSDVDSLFSYYCHVRMKEPISTYVRSKAIKGFKTLKHSSLSEQSLRSIGAKQHYILCYSAVTLAIVRILMGPTDYYI